MSQKFIIASFDPASTRNLGWATTVLDKNPSKNIVSVKPITKPVITDWACGTFVMPVLEDRWKVLWPIFAMSEAFLNENKPNIVVIEQTSNFAGGFITGQVSQCIGAIFAAAGKLDCNIEFAYPSNIKKIVAGHGRAKKGVIKKATTKLLEANGIEKMKFDSEHAADASANIFYWLIKHKVIEPLDFGDKGTKNE